MKQSGKLGLFLLTGLLVLIWNFPVYPLAARIEAATGGSLQVLGSSGSIWNGQIRLGLSDGARVSALPGAVKWRLTLLQQDYWASVAVEHANLVLPVHLGLNSDGISVTGGEIRMPASWLGAIGAPFNTIRPEGLLQLSWADWQVGRQVQASVKWLDAQSVLTSVRPIGEYMLALTGTPGTNMSMVLSSTKGPLTMEGTGQWTNGQGFSFNGYASADERSKEALKGLLSQMGKQEGERYRLGVF